MHLNKSVFVADPASDLVTLLEPDLELLTSVTFDLGAFGLDLVTGSLMPVELVTFDLEVLVTSVGFDLGGSDLEAVVVAQQPSVELVACTVIGYHCTLPGRK